MCVSRCRGALADRGKDTHHICPAPVIQKVVDQVWKLGGSGRAASQSKGHEKPHSAVQGRAMEGFTQKGGVVKGTNKESGVMYSSVFKASNAPPR